MSGWYYVTAVDEATVGPVSLNDFIAAFKRNEVNGDCVCWCDEMSDWQPLNTLPVYAKFQQQQQQQQQPKPKPTPTPTPVIKKAPTTTAAPKSTPAPTESKQQQHEWVELFTTDGLAYYFNKTTNATTWEKPDVLKSPEELDRAGEWVWARHEYQAFVPARVTSKFVDGRVEVECEDGTRMVVKGPELEPLVWSQTQRLVRDLVMLDEMNKPLILHNLQRRFASNEIYTNVGTILISVNPYKQLPLYTPSMIDDYRHRGSKQLPPHVFTIADDSYNSMQEEKKGQSIVISGESGAGKTEATKQCLQYLAEVAGSETNVEQKILMANPILEAFGNAKTVRNNNSSRFGKYVEIYFDRRYTICGSETLNYLLEKSRVVRQANGERNFHIFYQLCTASDARQQYGVRDAKQHYYLNQSNDITVPGVSDSEEYTIMTKAMQALTFTAAESAEILQIVAAIIHMGDISFREIGDRKCEVQADATSSGALKWAAKLLKVTEAQLVTGLTTRTMRMPGQREDILIHLGTSEAENARDALAKFVYAKLFDYLVIRINQAIGKGVQGDKNRRIGILDIFGFEIFELNSFEQLCINFTNEMLQQYFNQHTFKLEEQLYHAEQIKFVHVEYIDNQGVLDLIAKKPHGIIPYCDEELRMPKGSDQTLIAKLHQYHKHGAGKTKEYDTVLASADRFVVYHYAGAVSYDINGFLVKNADRLNEDTYALIDHSNNQFLKKQLFGGDNGSGNNNNNRAASLGTKFSQQLSELMHTLNLTTPHYIRCIKPNPNKAALEFCGAMVLEQLQYSGVFEAVQIRKQGYPFRLTHADFWKRYRCVCPKKKWASPAAACTDLVRVMEQDPDSVQMGRTMMLYRAKQHRDMELRRNLAVEATVIFLQKHIRAWMARKLFKRLRKLRPVLEAAIRSRNLAQVERALESCTGVTFEILEITQARRLRFVLIEEKRVNAILAELVKKDPESVFDELSKAVASANDIELKSAVAEQARKQLAVVKDMRKCRADLVDGVTEVDEEKLTWALNKAKELRLNAAQEVRAAEAMLKRIGEEKKLLTRVEGGILRGGWHTDGDVIDAQTLGTLVDEMKRFDVKTPVGVKMQTLAQCLLAIRRALLAAMGTKDRALWRAAGDATMLSGDDWVEHAEVQAARALIARQAAVEEIAENLERACEQMDQDALTYNLSQATELQMDHELYPVVPVAQQYLASIVDCRTYLANAMKVVKVYDLAYAMEYADSIGLATDEVAQCRALRDQVVQLSAEASFALDVLVEDTMRGVLERADAIGMTTPDVEQIRTLLYETAEEKFVQLQMKAAVKHHDPTRVINVTIRLKDIFFKKSGPMFSFENFPVMRSPEGWASLKFLTLKRDELAAGMHYHTTVPIHAALCELDSKRNKEAVKVFKNLMGFMGDRAYDNPRILALEIVTKGLEDRGLVDEIFCQLVKQLRRNHSSASAQRGWQMMAVCLEHFGPNEFENYLEMFLRSSAPEPKDRFIRLLHASVYGGARRTVVSQSELDTILAGQMVRMATFGEEKQYMSPVAELQSSDYYQQMEATQAEAHKAPALIPVQQPHPPVAAAASYATNAPTTPTLGPRVSMAHFAPPSIPQPARPAGPPRGPSLPPRNTPQHQQQPQYQHQYQPQEPSVSRYALPSAAAPTPTPAPVPRRGSVTERPVPQAPPAPAPQSEWNVAYTEAGDPYYYSTVTGAVQWDKPAGFY